MMCTVLDHALNQ